MGDSLHLAPLRPSTVHTPPCNNPLGRPLRLVLVIVARERGSSFFFLPQCDRNQQALLNLNLLIKLLRLCAIFCYPLLFFYCFFLTSRRAAVFQPLCLSVGACHWCLLKNKPRLKCFEPVMMGISYTALMLLIYDKHKCVVCVETSSEPCLVVILGFTTQQLLFFSLTLVVG